MYLLPYETTACQRLYKDVSTKITSKIRRAELDMQLPPMETPGNHKLTHAVFVTPSREHEDIPRFTQYVNMGTTKDPLLACDSRQYMTLEERTGTYRLVSSNDWKLQCLRVSLNNVLLTGDNDFYSRLTLFPARLFARWIPALLTTKFNLGPESIMPMQVICALYYQAMVYPDLRKVGDERYKEVDNLYNITGVPRAEIMQLLDKLGDLACLADLAHELSVNGNTIRMGQLTDQALLVAVGASWFGVNGRENVQIALEHLPTWIALIFMAIDDRSYRKASLAVRVETAALRGERETFIENVTLAVDKFYAS